MTSLANVRPRALTTLLVATLTTCALQAANPPQYVLDPTFNAPLFTARAVALRVLMLPDDRFYVYGGAASSAFQRVDGLVKGNIFRCNADGTVDHTFQLDARLQDQTIVVATYAPGGQIYVSAVPATFIDGNDRVFRLNSDGSLDTTFDAGTGATRAPGPNGFRRIRALAVDGLGRVIVGGLFEDFSNSGRRHLVRLTPTGAVDSSFAPVSLAASGSLVPSVSPSSHMGLAVQSDNKLIITGAFTRVNDVDRAKVARLNTDGTLDQGFVPSGYVATSTVHSVIIEPDGKVLLGGILRADNSALNRVLLRLESTGARDPNFNVNVNLGAPQVRGLKLLADGSILVAGTTHKVLRFASNGTYDSAFVANEPTFPQIISNYAVDTQSNGKIIFSGEFQSLNSDLYSGFARLEANGALDSTLHHPITLERETFPAELAARSDGKIVVSGDFDRVNGVDRMGSAVLNHDGSLSSIIFPDFVTYLPPGPPGFLVPPHILLLPGDQTLLFGSSRFSDSGLDARRLNSDGSEDNSFALSEVWNGFSSVLRDDSGRYLLSAGFSPQSLLNLVLLQRLYGNGTLDESFAFGVQLFVRFNNGALSHMYAGENRALAALPGGKSLFKFFNGANYVVLRLEPLGNPDETFSDGLAAPMATYVTFPAVFDPYHPSGPTTVQPPNGAIQPTAVGPACVLFLPDGRIIMGGEFVSYNGTPAGSLVQLSADGALLSNLGGGASFATPPENPRRDASVRGLQLESTGRILALGDFDRYNGTPAPGLVRIDSEGTRDTSFVSPLVRRSTGTTWTENPMLVPETAGSFLIVGNYATAPGVSTATSIFRLVPVPVAVSRKTHGNGGSFDVNLPFDGAAGIESRSGNHQIVVSFPAAVTFTGATVTSGTGSVSNATGSGTDVLTFDLTGVANAQTISVTIAGVNDGTTTKDIVVRMSTLVGDSNESGVVNAGDVIQTRNRSGQPTDAINFRSDFNLDGNVNSGDAFVVRARSGNSL